MEKKKISVLSIIFYVLAALLLAYAIWAAVYSIDYISQAIQQNQLIVEGYEFEIASFYMSNVAQYVVFAAILFGIGWILQKLEADKETDYDEDDWYEEEEWVEEEPETLVEEIQEEEESEV